MPARRRIVFLVLMFHVFVWDLRSACAKYLNAQKQPAAPSVLRRMAQEGLQAGAANHLRCRVAAFLFAAKPMHKNVPFTGKISQVQDLLSQKVGVRRKPVLFQCGEFSYSRRTKLKRCCHSGGVGMIRSELIQKIADENPHLYQRDVERIVNTIFDEVTGAMARGDRVELRGFGAFSVKKRDARVGRNPRTGETVHVDEKHVPFFKTGKLLRDRLNGKS